MTKAAEKVKAELAALSDEDREEIFRFLADAVGLEWVSEDKEWEAELDRRAEDIDKNPAAFEDGETFMKKLREKYS